MMKMDLLVAWPQHLDYPRWRHMIRHDRSRFNKVIVVFTQMNAGKDYRPWLQGQFNQDQITSISNDTVSGSQDWRDVAVNKGLGLADAPWIFFTEPDFFPRPGFWEQVENASEQYRAIGVKQDERLHPCCLFLRRDLLGELDKNFGVVTDKLDHFGVIQQQLEERNEAVGIIPPDYWHHLNGLSQNMYLLQIGQVPNYEPEKFKDYCRKCLQTDMEIQPEIKELLEAYV